MQKIKVFLASSINEFKNERNEIGNLIRKMQDDLIDQDIRIKLFECEFYDVSISTLGRKQNDYNEDIKNCDIFIMLVGKKIGMYTEEEYNVALASNKAQLNVFFKNVDYDESVVRFKNIIAEHSNTNTFTFSNYLELENYIIKIIKNFLN